MGFRDIGLFNQAMLAKQAWRILQNGSTLLARSLKARYFPRADILLASKAHNPSFVWKSLLVGRDLLVEGIAWRMGDGSRIRIGLDAWLPDGFGKFQTARVHDRWANYRVADLLLDNQPSWDMSKLANILPGEDLWKFTDNLSVNPSIPDRPFWPSGRSNMYSVKFGYLLACSLRNRNLASTSIDNTSLWNWVWALEVIPKVKFFLWKSLVGALPTSGALLDRSISVDPIYRRCGEDMETTEHALRDCPWVAFLWETSPLRLPPLNSTEFCSIKEWIDRIRLVPNKEVHQTFANLAWTIWYSRNLLLFQDKSLTHFDCFKISQRAIWMNQLAPPKWVPNLPRFSVAEILRSGFLAGAFTVEEGEARAILEGLRLCAEKGFTKAILETDCQLLYWRLCKREDDFSYLGNTLRQIYTLMDSFVQIQFSWAPRSENSFADSLAKHALHDRFSLVSAEALPFVLNFTGLS
ncbi:uncharacterized protein LOC131022916 [Salvia miltiorrhiza]|uniref:uncharacterized protein LOC131022916 n=1 Tax=Salvia miltiorrhiza TaxID=226208 RepID=UPI0025ACEBA3|nr:uncharacterized protein LOC131022916 [Salvia miltiorrhiza]